MGLPQPDGAKPEDVSGARAPEWHALSTEDVLATLESDTERGLSAVEARSRLERVGPNALPEGKRRSGASIFFAQFKSPLIYLLFAAAGIALALGHTSDAVVIFIVVLLNALVGAVQEGRAERSLEALRKLASHSARVVRDGSEQVVDVRDIVPGDVLVLEAGDAVAADARIVEAAALQMAEAALTGESAAISKHHRALSPDTPLADRLNMVYAGTHATAGRAHAVVVATGTSTEIGRIASLAEAAERPETPLERRVRLFGRTIMIAAACLFAAVLAIGLVRSVPLGQIVMVGISQVVGMIPEGLPVAMTIALAVGVQRMARRKAVVRALSAVETLGSTTVICTDKTGTLTRNEMTVTAIWLPEGRQITVSGSGYEPSGTFAEGGAELAPSDDATLRALLEAGLLCNDAQLRRPDETETRWMPIGDPTEVALVVAAAKAGLPPEATRKASPRRAEIPFDSSTKMMATEHDAGHGSRIFVKGAPEVILSLCGAARLRDGDRPLDDAARRQAEHAAEHMANQALRVLAVGVVEDATLAGSGFEALTGRVTLLGFFGQIDPPRSEVKEAVARCRAAGIRPVMVTGDHKSTAQAIAAELGIARSGDTAVDGRELEALGDDELSSRIDRIAVFARVHPAQKLRIVGAFQNRQEVVAMTGDGVNDAPALVKADVGVAMGITGTEVAKESAKIVIGDDNFATIVAAVEEGRVVYRNIKKVVLYLFSTSMAEVVVLVLGLLLGYPPPLAAVQILWINLVTEGVVTVNLIMEPAEGDEMSARPTPPGEALLSGPVVRRIAFMTPSIAASALGWYVYRIESGVPFPQVQTETFTVLAICQWYNVLNCRSELRSALRLSLLRNPWLIGGLALGNLLQFAVVFLPFMNEIFHTVPISLGDAVTLGVVGSLVFWVEELRKLFARRRAGASGVSPQRREFSAPAG